jgi:hypothetical protein
MYRMNRNGRSSRVTLGMAVVSGPAPVGVAGVIG